MNAVATDRTELVELLSDAEYGAPKTATLNGVTYRCIIEPDQDTSVMGDYDCFGQMAWVERDRDTGREASRPVGYNGRARKLHTPSGDRLWWNPPSDVADKDLDALASTICDLLEYGFVGIVVERLDGTDVYGNGIAVAVASLWGIESMATNEDKADVIGTLLSEVGDR